MAETNNNFSPMSPDEFDALVIRNVKAFKTEAESAKATRLKKDKDNDAVYLSEHDFSHKVTGQSKVVVAKQPMAIEQIAAFVKRSLIKFGDWFSLELNRTDLKLDKVTFFKFTKYLLEQTNFYTVLSDGIKQALNHSLMVFKVHGKYVNIPTYASVVDHTPKAMLSFVKTGRLKKNLVRTDHKSWRLVIELVPTSQYFPDPTGKNLYEIHSVPDKDLSDVLDWAEAPNSYVNKEALAALKTECHRDWQDQKERAHQQNQDVENTPKFRKTVKVDEFWGTIFDDDGTPKMRSIYCIIVNDKHILVRPRKNPFWHGKSIFVPVPLIRVPHSVWHKALMDHATPLAIDINELMSMMVDGAKAAVWGVKTVKPDNCEDPSEISGGIPYGATVREKQTAVGKTIDLAITGQVPNDAISMYNQLSREHEQATLSNSLTFGQIPSRQVKATEIVEASQNQEGFFVSIATDVEKDGIEPLLTLSWMTAMQFVDDFLSDELIALLGPEQAHILQRMSPEDRFASIALAPKFKVGGLSSVLKKIQDYTKMVAFATFLFNSPLLTNVFVEKYSLNKFVDKLLKGLEIDPDELELSEEEKTVMKASLMEGLAGGANPSTGSPPNAGKFLPSIGGGEQEVPEEEFASKQV